MMQYNQTIPMCLYEMASIMSFSSPVFPGHVIDKTDDVAVATIKALKYLKHKSNITIFTDSKYVIDGINNWILKWKHNNWKTANKKEVKNKELWLDLYKCISFHSVDWKWVKGHSGNPLNEEVDKIAREEAEKIISS